MSDRGSNGEELQHMICGPRISIETRLRKLRERKDYSSKNRLQEITLIICGLLADYSRDRATLDELFTKLVKLNDDTLNRLKVSQSTENRIDEKINELHNLVNELLDKELESMDTIMDWFEKSCEVVRKTFHCISLEIRFPSDGDFKRLFYDLLNRNLYHQISTRVKKQVLDKFTETIKQFQQNFSCHDATTVFEKLLSMCEIQLSCSVEDITDYLSKSGKSITIKIEVSRSLTDKEKQKAASESEKLFEVFEKKVSDMARNNHEAEDFKKLLHAYFRVFAVRISRFKWRQNFLKMQKVTAEQQASSAKFVISQWNKKSMV